MVAFDGFEYKFTYTEVPGRQHAPEYWRKLAGGHRDAHIYVEMNADHLKTA